MIIKSPPHKPAFCDPVSPWHYWFAWRPVFTWDGRFVWLRTVLRRKMQKKLHLNGPDQQWFEYHRQDGYAKDDAEGSKQ